MGLESEVKFPDSVGDNAGVRLEVQRQQRICGWTKGC